MEEHVFNETLPRFHKLAVECLTAKDSTLKIQSNYVKSSYGRWYSYISLDLDGSFLEFVISYSEFYQEPVLYHLRDHDPGKTVDIEQCVPEIHPIIQRPFLFLHQCETKTIMETMNSPPLKYLESWFGIYLSFVSPDLSLRVPSNYNILS